MDAIDLFSIAINDYVKMDGRMDAARCLIMPLIISFN